MPRKRIKDGAIGPRRHTAVCQVCGTVFPVDPYLIAKGFGKFCSTPCSTESRRSLNSTPEHFWARLDRSTECWVWTGKKSRKYGVTSFDGKMWRTHKLAWVLANGAIPDGLSVLHNCPGGDNPACCRPSHLWLGTQAENMMDMYAKGRGASFETRSAASKAHNVRGENHPWRLRPDLIPRGERASGAKVTADIVRLIRERYANGGVTQERLGNDYGLSRRQVSGIVSRTEWSHIL